MVREKSAGFRGIAVRTTKELSINDCPTADASETWRHQVKWSLAKNNDRNSKEREDD